MNSGKCEFGRSNLIFLGHDMSADGIKQSPDKVAAVASFDTPGTSKQLQRFCGMLNYYHRFVPHVAEIMKPLYAAISKQEKNLNWTEDMTAAFKKSKDALSQAAQLAHPVSDAKLFLTVDASNVAVGGVLEQLVSGVVQPLGFFSRKLSKSELRYSTFDREVLAAYLAIKHFRHFVEGRDFTIFTDHKPLVSAMFRSSDPWSARQQRHLSAISEFTTDIQHISGKDNLVADALSRSFSELLKANAISLINPVSLSTYEELSAAQEQNKEELDAVLSGTSSLSWQKVSLDGTSLWCDVSLKRPRPWVPNSLRYTVFSRVHSLSHPSAKTTVRMVSDRFVWHGLKKEVAKWSRECIPCQKAKINRHTKTPLGQFPLPSRRFAHLHVDLVGPLPPSEGFRYLFTVIDRATRWIEAVPLSESSTKLCVNALLSHWISRFGIPDHLTSDRGPQFTSELWRALSECLGYQLHHTTAYRPEANGMVERSHRYIKDALKARILQFGGTWHQHLPWILLGIRSAPREPINASSAELLYGEKLVLPGDFFPGLPENFQNNEQLQRARDIANDFVPVPPRSDETNVYIPRDMYGSDYVFVRVDKHQVPLSPPYSGPYPVLERSGKAFKVQLPRGPDWVSLDRLKPAHLACQPETTTSSGRVSRMPERYGFG